MADRKQQYLDILKGYGVDISTLQYAPERQLRQIVEQTRQAPDTGGGEMAVGKAAAGQAAQDVIGGTTPAKPLEELLLEAHTGPAVTPEPSMASETMLPAPEADTGSIYDVEPRQHRLRDDDRRPPVSVDQPDMRERLPSGVVKTDLPAFRPTDELTAEAHTGPTVIPEPSMASETMLPMDAAPKMTDPDATADWRALRDLASEAHRVTKPTLRPDRTPMQMTGQPSEPEPISTGMVDQPAMPQDAPPGLLSRLGKAIGENPDIALAGMEGIGSLLANIGAARGQRKADEATKQGMARSNLVSALTGGKVRPAVAEETPEMGFLGRLGQAVGTAGKFGREVEKTRYERGFQEEEQERKYDIKEAEVERKVAADVRKMMTAVGKNKLTEAQAQKVLSDITLNMTAEERRLYTTKWRERAEFAGLLVKQKAQTLAEQKWDDQKLLQEQGQKLDQAYFDLSKEHKNELWGKWKDELSVDQDRIKIDKDRAEAYVDQVKNEGERIALQKAGEDRKSRREVMNIVKNNLNGDVLKKFMGSERGAFNTYQGLMAAWNDFESAPTSANMNGVFNMYQQLFDPATVREGDLELQRRGQGVFADAYAAGERLKGEGFVLEQETIEEMKRVADSYYDDALAKERIKLDAYLKDFVDPQDAESIRSYYNTIWGTPGAGAGGNEADEFLEG